MARSAGDSRMIWFNDNDIDVAVWLQNLYRWPDGVVDPRSVTEIRPHDVLGHTRAHFFAGIGGWEYALQLAGWPDFQSVWTASLPCQPFSGAGKQRGTNDERHLWPHFRNLVAQCRPPVIFGEQVASPLGREWLSGVRADLEALGYAVGAADLCAASVAAPHIRQRLYWVAYSEHHGYDRPRAVAALAHRNQQIGRVYRGGTGGMADDDSEGRRSLGIQSASNSNSSPGSDVNGSSSIDIRGMADTERDAREPGWAAVESGEGSRAQSSGPHDEPRRRGSTFWLGDTDNEGSQGRLFRRDGSYQRFARPPGMGPWGNFDAIECSDGKVRRFEPGSFPLANGIPARTLKLRAYGNAIVPQVAATFVKAFLNATG